MILLLSIIAISSFTFVGAWYARKYEKSDCLIALYVVFAALSQVIATKIAVFDFGFTSVTAPAAVIIFAVTFLITDIVNEKFGQREVHRMIFITFLTQLALAAFLYIGVSLPPAPFWTDSESWNGIFGMVPRIYVST